MVTPERILKRILMIALCVVLVIYVTKQLANLVNSTIETETALAVTSEEVVELEGYVMRCETVLFSDSEGTMLASVKDGERVPNGREAVRVYSTENDYSVENSIRDIENRIDILDKSSIDTAYVSTDMDKLDDEIEDLLAGSLIYTAQNDLVGALSYRDDILVEMNKRWLLSHPGKSFSDKIAELKAERDSYKGKLTQNYRSVNTDRSGYYYSTTDGYENIFSSSKIDGLTLEEFDKMKNSSPETYSGKTAGKIVTEYNWYIACPITADRAGLFEPGAMYNIEFTYNYGTVLEMTLHSRIIENNRDDALLIFASNKVPADFEFVRNQKIKVIYKQYKGLKVPKEAVRIVDDIKGVYVVNGTRIEFKRAEEIYSFDDYYIIDSDPESSNYAKKYERKIYTDKSTDEKGEKKVSYYRSLSLYDTVVVKGKDIYDGMKVE